MAQHTRGLLTLTALLLCLSLAPPQAGADEEVAMDPIDRAKAPCEKADAEINRVYKKIRKVYKNDKEFLEKLRLAQRAWIKFRDSHIRSIFPIDEPYYYGSVVNECHCWIYADLTEERTKTLKVWLQGTEEGDLCAGSVKWTDQLRK
jgi:uncharacterized protein YecT (DUF1311 family)